MNLNKTAIPLLLLLLLSPFILKAQLQETIATNSEVIISPAEMQSLLEELMQFKQKRIQQTQQTTYGFMSNTNVAQALQEQNLEEKINAIEKLLLQINERLASGQTTTPPLTLDEVKDQDLGLLKIALQSELETIKGAIQALAANPISPQVPSSINTADSSYQNALTGYFILYAQQMTELQNMITQLHQQVDSLSQKSDIQTLQEQFTKLEQLIQRPISVQQEGDTSIIQTPFSEEIKNYWDQQFAAIGQLLEERPVSTAPITTIDKDYEQIKALIKGKENRYLLFDNNTFQLKPEHNPILEDIAQLLYEEERLDILILGFTSAKGTPLYNQSLSQQRADQVKKELMAKGIHPSRVFTEYHGIDYQSSDPVKSRRVELIFLIRK